MPKSAPLNADDIALYLAGLLAKTGSRSQITDQRDMGGNICRAFAGYDRALWIDRANQ